VDRLCVEKIFEQANAGRLVLAILWGLSLRDAPSRLREIGAAPADVDRHLLAVFRQSLVDGHCIADHLDGPGDTRSGDTPGVGVGGERS
jgi:type II secretory ATPase GspE/PulE/Tfp pilus assembly ATPase PilB-like protein